MVHKQKMKLCGITKLHTTKLLNNPKGQILILVQLDIASCETNSLSLSNRVELDKEQLNLVLKLLGDADTKMFSS